MSRPVTARVFVEGSNRAIKLAEPDTDAVFEQYKQRVDIEGVTVEGERFIVEAGRVVDVLGPPTPVEAEIVEPDPMIMEGRKVTFRSYDLYRRDELRHQEEHGGSMRFEEYPKGTIAVLAEDMGEVLILAVSTTGEVLWENPASDPGSIARYVRAARLVAEAEHLQLEGDKLTYPVESPEVEDDKEAVEDQKNGEAHLHEGNIGAALRLLGPDVVAAFLSERGFAADVVVTDGDVQGEIVGYAPDPQAPDRPSQGVFKVEAGGAVVEVGIDQIEVVTF